MELYKQTKDNLTFKHKEITFFIRAEKNAHDKFCIDCLYRANKDGTITMPLREFYTEAIRLFVVSWNGVTQDGKAVAFSMENLFSLPFDHTDDIITILGAWITNHVGLLPSAEETDVKKNLETTSVGS